MLDFDNISDNWVNELTEMKEEQDRCDEKLPSDEQILSNKNSLCLNGDDTYKVYTTCQFTLKYLTDERFEIVDSIDAADILCIEAHFKDYE